MKVLFDYQAFQMQTHGGVSRCFAELYKYFPKEVEPIISIEETNNAYLREMGIGVPFGSAIENFVTSRNFPIKGRLCAAYKHLTEGIPYRYKDDYNWTINNYNQLKTIKLLTKGDFDIFHPTYFRDYYLPYLNGKPFVLTIHDMIPELYPQYFNHETDIQILMKRKLVPLASAIVTVSETTKADVVRILNVPEERVFVVYHGSEHISVAKPTIFETYPFDKFSPYILYVGERHWYKDFDMFVDEVAITLRRHPELKVVCTGEDFTQKEISRMNTLGIRDRFIHYWVKTDREFTALYHNAVCFVYTSEYEGFGIPILEAYNADCPVMLNKASCFPEIAGDAAVYFEFTKEGTDFCQRFEELYVMSKEQHEQLLLKQRYRLQLYSWKKSAEQLAKVYKSIL